MRRLRSWFGLTLTIIYLMFATWARASDETSSPIMLKNFLSDVVSLPALATLKIVGIVVEYRDDRAYRWLIALSALLVYLFGALVQAGVRALRNR